jgi:pimeloyl-ACP methyl ester carboxylesterase
VVVDVVPADAVAVLEHLGYDRVAVYGTSMGGRVAQMLAIHRASGARPDIPVVDVAAARQLLGPEERFCCTRRLSSRRHGSRAMTAWTEPSGA